MNRQNVIVHYHIFKNAGSSVDVALRSMFGQNWGVFDGNGPHDVITSRRFGQFLQAHPELRAVSSHLARPPLPHRRCCPIVFLRDPLLRARSVYAFVKADRSQPQHEVAAKRSFGEFISYYLDEYTRLGRVISDYQVFHLSSASFRRNAIGGHDVIDTDLAEAKKRLTKWGFTGLVERFGLSLERYSKIYSESFEGLMLRSFHENKSTEADYSVGLSATLEAELGPALMRRFIDQNRRDYELYHWSLARFHS